MNYRHIYHAGNFADVFKHLLLIMATDYLSQKDKGMFLLDAFAGCGHYDLNRHEVGKTNEYLDGIERIMSVASLNPDLKAYQARIAPHWKARSYPGSPLLMAETLRPQDRLVANELHPDDYETLRFSLARFTQARITRMDAYECIRANIPPEERRGIVLIDPPFEKPNEFELLARQMWEWKKRWPTGCYMIWYPIKAGMPIAELHDEARDVGMNRTWVSEFLLNDRDQPGTLNGCGMLVFNTPFQMPERLTACSVELGALMNGHVDSLWLTGE